MRYAEARGLTIVTKDEDFQALERVHSNQI
ncbi:MAG: hypothetical protein HY777_01265 [Betaproteobacteria bacterium]|nr:hypothetical protein [Betaproteobacteria bacterium]